MIIEIMNEREERNWTVFCHLGGLLPFYFLNIVIPLAIWLTQRSKSSFIYEQGQEITNFQISLTIYGACLLLLGFTVIGIPVTIAGYLFLAVLDIVSVIRGALRASKGQDFRYPLNLRLLK
jgi:uncharacterized Tic20 family protein